MTEKTPRLATVDGKKKTSSTPDPSGDDQELSHPYQEDTRMNRTDRLTIIGTIIGSAVTLLAALAIISSGFLTQAAADRATAQSAMDAFRTEAATDRRAAQIQLNTFNAKADADRAAFNAKADADRTAFQREMALIHADTRLLAERQSRVEGILYSRISGEETDR